MFKLGVSLSPTKTKFGPLLFAGDLLQGLEVAKKLGYAGVELSLLESSRIDQFRMIDQLAALELQVFAIATGQSYVTDGYALYAIDKQDRRAAVERLKDHIEFAAKLGSAVIIGGIRGKIGLSGDRFIKGMQQGNLALKTCFEYAEEAGVALLLEPVNRYETDVVNTIDEGLDLIEELGSPNLRLLPDTFHMNIEERSLEESIIRAGSRIGYVHFADSNRMAPGWGHLDFTRILSALEKIGYEGPIGIEVLPKPDDLRAAEQAIRHLNSLANQKK
jgi:sugar phosphate isomerase/epimerase